MRYICFTQKLIGFLLLLKIMRKQVLPFVIFEIFEVKSGHNNSNVIEYQS